MGTAGAVPGRLRRVPGPQVAMACLALISLAAASVTVFLMWLVIANPQALVEAARAWLPGG